MRHTLIPTELKKSLRHEYRVRVSVVLLFMISAAGLVAVVSLLPSFIHAMNEKDNSERALMPLQKIGSSTDSSSIEEKITEQSNLIKLFLDNSKGGTSYSSLVENVVEARGMIKITSLAISQVSTTSMNTIIQGVAPTRNALLSFKSRLESAAKDNIVDLPVGELAKSNDINFSLSLSSVIQP